MADNWIHKVRSNTLQTRLFADLEKGIFTDIIFRVGPDGNQRTFKAHRVVLASENSEFENMLYGSDDSGKIEIPDVHPKGFENLIRYCYGESFLFKDLASIRNTHLVAEKFKAKKLQQRAEDNLIDLLKSESLIEILKVCIELDMSRAKERCLEVISSRLKKVLMTKELILAPIEVIEPILSLCEDQDLVYKIYAVFTLLAWAKQHECSNSCIRHLLSMIQGEHAASDMISFFKTGGELTKSQLQDILNSFFSKIVCSLQKNLFLESTNASENTADILRQDIAITKVESSEAEQETSLQVQISELKDKKMVIDLEEASWQKSEKMNETDEDFIDEGSVIDATVMQSLIEEASNLIKYFVARSTIQTVNKVTTVAGELTLHAAGKMQEAVDNMVDSLQFITTCNSNTVEKTEVNIT